ncbi:glutaredoxin [Catenovulum sp. 2E275]|uniref:glutaredoxin n=1 Tax=Catenovulum sp. 2E275 TaxID=2980497 RepID=UPI0021D0A6D2|nr:glutaredoxin [Catenovulum sp. 2E275]MCU4676523.1 glutaredoxin [Catenovulum sp. 2E275]
MQAQNRIYRKKMCPWGQKAVQLLDQHQVSYQDHLFDSKDEELQFKKELSVTTTPQIFIDGKHIGGYRELQRYFNAPIEHGENQTQYLSLVILLGFSGLLSFVLGLGLKGFLGIGLSLFATLKLMDLKAFVFRFKQYDMIAKKLPAYGFIFPFIQLIAGFAILAGLFHPVICIIAILFGLLGIGSIVKSLFIDKHRFNCGSVGGHYPLPLSILSFVEPLLLLIPCGLFLV